MSESQPLRVFTIPPGEPFLETLASAVLAGGFPAPEVARPDPLALSEYRLLVPTRRATRALAEAFLRAGGGEALLLPEIRPIGDVDEAETAFAAAGGLSGNAETELALPPAIDPLARQLLLTRLILDWADRAPAAELRAPPTPAQAARLAAELAALIDSFEAEEIGLDAILALAEGEFADHWQTALEFLDIVRVRLPEEMARLGVMSPIDRRNRLMAAEAERLAGGDVRRPIIAAGSTGTVPATRRLLKIIAGLPHGAVVLPGLDLDLDERSWEAVGEAHPQYGMKMLLDHLGIRRSDVQVLTGGRRKREAAARARLLSEVTRPAETTEHWHSAAATLEPELDTAVAGLTLVRAPSEREEALAIALILRHALETPGKTAALVTPSRGLARRVSAELARWGIEADDTAGRPLAATPPASLSLLVLDAVLNGFAPVPLAALLAHPLARFGLEPQELRRRARLLDIAALRGPVPPPGLEAIRARLALAADPPEGSRPHAAERRIGKRDWPLLDDLVSRIEAALEPLCSGAGAASPVPIPALVEMHVTACEAVAGASALWSGNAGDALSALFAGLIEHGGTMPAIEPSAYAPLLREFMAGRVVRPDGGAHPRLAIRGLLEARLLGADVAVLGGLADGTWPPHPNTDGWLNRPMRTAIGLPAPERRIGLTAHDFVQSAAAPEAVLTWSDKSNGKPVVPSRWLLRLRALLPERIRDDLARRGDRWLHLGEALDRPRSEIRIAPPRPCPPVAARPTRMSVTRIEEWVRDPYATYARSILGLEPLPRLAEPAGPAQRGTLVHHILNAFAQRYPGPLPPDAHAILLDIANEAFEAYRHLPEVRAFWMPRFARMARWLVAEEATLRDGVTRLYSEVTGEMDLEAGGMRFKLTARADRIDVDRSGHVTIYDYKTGAPASEKQMASGLAPQLPLEAALAMHGGFAAIGAAQVADLAFIRLSGGTPPGEVRRLKKETAVALAQRNLDGLLRRIAQFARPETPYVPRAAVAFEKETRDFDHLSRLREWGVQAETET